MGRPTRTIHAGEHFGHLTAIECCGHTAKGDLRWKLSCICGTVVVRRNTHLWRGRSLGYASSCGCITKRQIKGAPKSRADVVGFTQKEKAPSSSWWAIYAAPETAFDVFQAAAKRRVTEAGWKSAGRAKTL